MAERRFPILLSWQDERDFPDYPRSVPWSFVAPHEKQAEENHDQSLELLAKRGGLDPSEMLAIVTGKRWNEIDASQDGLAANRDALLALLAATLLAAIQEGGDTDGA